MVFSDTTTKQGIIQTCERFCNTGEAGISGNAQLLYEFTANANAVLRHIWHIIFMAYGGWQYDDSNQTDLPAGATALVASQTSYPIPTGAITIRGVEVLNSNGSNWIALRPITEEQIREREAMGEFLKTASTPEYYQLVGDTIRLFPAANYNSASGLKVFFDRGSVAFAYTDTTKTPGFVSEYHDAVPLGASIEYLKIKTPSDAALARLKEDYVRLVGDEQTGQKGMIEKFYSRKFSNMFPPRMTVRDPMNEAR